MNSFRCKLTCLVVILVLKLCETVELTFELPDNAKECFFQEIEKNQTATLEFQVIKLFDVKREQCSDTVKCG